ncbi:MAG TPA: PVC-type heme-binding CxxCH protein [Pirellulaceae bacterium]
MSRTPSPVCLCFLGCLLFVSAAAAQEEPASNSLNEPLGDPGIIPVDDNGKPLNLNFETGTLEGWKAEGKAFEGQPVKGDIATLRPSDKKKSDHTGQYWLGGYEKLKDQPQGSLTSEPFTVTHPYASFLVGGGSRQVRVAIVLADNNQVFYWVPGKDAENLRPVIVDMQPIMGKKVFIRIVDQGTAGWGHINFDDFRFHSTRPRFKSLANELPTPEATALYPHAGLSAQEAAKAMAVPAGFKVEVGAAEPDVQQPIAMAIDDRGRVWIAEAYEYPRRAQGDKGRDRILIFEDTDLNGTLDKRTVFYEGLNLVSGLELGFGGVWVGAAPYLLFIPDKDGDDKPDSEPQKLLDGFGYEDTHETLNSFIWGPDGWLYGCHGVFTHSKVGKPGTPADKRVPLNAGIWRYHPVRHEFEVFAHGTSNPWGLDYDQYGNFFATACVIPHFFHIIPGARYERQAGQHFNPYTYDDIKTIADHRHYTGNQWNDGNRRQSDTLGGGHAHAGCMIYQGGAWPEKYRGAVFMNNIHGNRMNVDLLEPHGSGFVAHHGTDFLFARDQWSQMLYMTYGPDGQVWVIDWYDMQQCHLKDVTKHDRSNGRIYRISYNNAKPVRVDLQQLGDAELVKLLTHDNEWYRRHAQRILLERAGTKKKQAIVIDIEIAKSSADLGQPENEGKAIRHRYADRFIRTTYLDPPLPAHMVDLASMYLKDQPRPHLLAAMMRDQIDKRAGWTIDVALRHMSDLARTTAAPQSVRLAIAVQLQSLLLDQRWSILELLTSHAEDASDHNLPLMYWYAMEPLADVDPPRALALALSAGEKIPILKEFMIRRIGAGDPAKSLDLLVDGLSKAKDDATRLTFLRGLSESLKGRRDVQPPKAWQQVKAELTKADSNDVRFESTVLSAGFGDAQAAKTLAATILDAKAPAQQRRQAITALGRAQSAELLPVLLAIVARRNATEGVPYSAGGAEGVPYSEALRGLASFEDSRVPQAILGVYGDLSPTERRDALATLCSRPTYAVALLDAVAAGKVPNNHLTADLITNLRNLNDAPLTKRIEQVWGLVRSSPEEKKKLIEDYKRLLTTAPQPRTPSPEPLSPELGRAVFAKTCQQCHTLFGIGGKVGPDITGSQRANLDYLLSNIIDPSAVMAKEYQPTIIRCADGRVVTGILKEETTAAISLATQNEVVVISKSDIEESKISDKSMMPDDLLKPLTPLEVRSLVAYLGSETQSPLAATPDNVGSFFNGKDLTGWRGDDKLWSVENGEIVGKTSGLKKNEFLMTELSIGDFKLELDIKLKDDKGNTGIQIRSVPIENGLMRGYQCDAGPGWWGKLYEEHGRALLESKGGEQFVKKGDWNHYEIVAVGSRVRTWLNGNLCVDRDDPEAARRGLIGLQLHSGGETEVHFKNLKLTLIQAPVPARPYPASKPASFNGEPKATASTKVSFKKTTLDRAFRSEGVGMGDFNNDGLLDISAGSVWYEAPSKPGGEWTMHVLGEKANSFDIKTYGDTFMNWAEDVDGDGRQDLIVVDFPGKPTWWFQNPGHASKEPWKKHMIVSVTNDESPLYLDGDGDGKRGLVYGDGANRLSIARPQSNPLVEWKQTPISAPGDVKIVNFYHGLGVGDINKDGINDIVVPSGWWQGVAEITSEPWTFHPADFGRRAGGALQPQAHMYVYDFDGDGDNDVVGSSAHARGIWWYEQITTAKTDGGGEVPGGSRLPLAEWKTHLIDESIAQTHALILADINGDGLPDLVTGKRYYAHNGRDPGEDEPPEIAWFELSRKAGTGGRGSEPVWTKHLFDSDSGVGTAFEVHDMNSDGLLDILVANKHGVYYFEQARE